MALTKVTSGGITDSAITSAKINDGAITNDDIKSDAAITAGKLSATLDLSSKTITLPSASVTAHVTQTDTTDIETNIALLGFYRATDHSKAKYNLVDQVIDEYTDATGVDAGNSTNESLSSGVYVGAIAGSAPTGATSTDTSISGYTTLVLSAASGSVVVPSSANVTMLVVAGGGGGAGTSGGGAGAGGLIYKATHALTAQTYAWVRGAGGAAHSGSSSVGNVGADSTWTDASASVEFTAKGGGGGGYQSTAATDGGSGGGAGHDVDGAGSATQSSQSGDSGTYGFGYDGANGRSADAGQNDYNTAGGGGAGSAGQAATSTESGDGGAGKDYSAIFGTAVGDSGWFASGGGGGYVSNVAGLRGHTSAGGGGAGSATANGSGDDGQALTGGGGGGSGDGGTGTTAAGGSGIILIRYANSAFISVGDLTLQSVANTAESAPTTGDMVTLIEDAAGTATINTDIKGYISRNGGTTFTQGTLVDEGGWGTNKRILAFHNLDISGQSSGTSMKYKITTHNQSASKETKIHATSLAWA